MAITVVQAVIPVQAASLTTATATFASPTTAGNTVVVCVTTASPGGTSPTVSGVTLGGSADNFAAVETNPGTASGIPGAIWFDPACAGGQTSVVVTCTGGAGATPNIYVAIYEISGVLLADQHTSFAGTAVGTWSSGTTGTTANPNEIFIGAATGSVAIPVVTGAGTWTSQSTGAGSFDQISGYQIVSAAGTAAYSGTLASGVYTALVATFAQAPSAPGAVSAQPGRTWRRRFHHRQQAVPVAAAVTAVAVPLPQRGAPVQARQFPAQGGRVTRRSGAYGQAGPPVKAPTGPVQARVPLGRGGHVTSRAGVYGQLGPPVKPAAGPVRARVPQPSRGGQVTRRAGVYGGLGPALKALASAVAGRLRGFPPRGRTAGRTGTYGQAGPPVKAAAAPVQARQLPRRGGSAVSRAGTFTSLAPQSGPPVYPLGHPVQARRLPQRGGSTSSRTGTYGRTGPPVKAAAGPVHAQPPPQRGGHTASRSGTLTAGAPQAGPPVYPLGRPVQARRQPLAGGRAARRAGTYDGAGAPAVPLRQPVSARRPPPPPARGRTASQRGPYGQAGPPVIRLRHPVRGQPQRPVLTGRAAWRAGTYTAPFVAPFTIGALTTGDKPGSALTAAGAASALAASTAPAGALTAGDQRTGGPGG